MSAQTSRGGRQTGTPSQMSQMSLSGARELVEEYPVSSTMLAFGIGLGVGVLIGHTIAGALAPEPTPTSRLDCLSQQVFESIRSAIPEAIGRHLPR